MTWTFLQRVEAISQLPDDQIPKFNICSDLSLKRSSTFGKHGHLALKLKKMIPGGLEKETRHTISKLSKALDYTLKMLPSAVSLLKIHPQGETCLIQFCRHLRQKIEHIQLINGVEPPFLLDKISQIAHIFFESMSITSYTEILHFFDLKRNWLQQVLPHDPSLIFLLHQIDLILKEIKPVENVEDLKEQLHQLQLIYLLKPGIDIQRQKDTIHKLFIETVIQICHFALPPEEWCSILVGLYARPQEEHYALIYQGVQKYMQTRIRELSSRMSATEIENEIFKNEKLYQIFTPVFQQGEEKCFLQNKKELLSLLIPFMKSYSNKIDVLKELLWTVDRLLPLEMIYWSHDEETYPLRVFIEYQGKLMIDPKWELVIDNASHHAHLFIYKALKHSLSCSTSSEIALNWLLQQDLNNRNTLFFLVQLFFKLDLDLCKETLEVLSQRMMQASSTQCHIMGEWISMMQKNMKLNEDTLEDLFPRLELLMITAQEAKHEEWIKECIAFFAMLFPLYLQDPTQLSFPLGIDDDILSRILASIDASILRPLRKTTELSIDFNHFPQLTIKSIDILLDAIPEIHLLNAFNHPLLSNVHVICNSKVGFYAHSRLLQKFPYYHSLYTRPFRESLDIGKAEEIELEIDEMHYDFLLVWLPQMYASTQNPLGEKPLFKTLFSHLACACFFQRKECIDLLDTMLYLRLEALSAKQRWFTLYNYLPLLSFSHRVNTTGKKQSSKYDNTILFLSMIEGTRSRKFFPQSFDNKQKLTTPED